MKLKRIELSNFRNHTNLNLDIYPNITIIQGKNGAGKTNILEAIYLLATGKSIRAKREINMINENAIQAIVRGIIEREEDTYLVQISMTKTETRRIKKQAKVNKLKKPITKATNILSAIIFEPEDLYLPTGSPSRRRKYLNRMISQIDREYKQVLNKYEKALKQRNKLVELIALGQQSTKLLPYWNNKLIEYGTYIQNKREEIINKINEHLKPNHVSIHYIKNRLGKTAVSVGMSPYPNGPHKDDYTIHLKDKDLGSYGSRGQIRISMIYIKKAQLTITKQVIGSTPILLLDDLFSELDDENKALIGQLIKDQQTIITTADTNTSKQLGIQNIITL